MKSFKSIVLYTLVALSSILLAFVLSCSQTLPTQFEVNVFRVDDSDYKYKDNNGVVWLDHFTESSPNWIDIDDADSTSRTTLFPGSKFNRTVAPQKIGFEGSDVHGKDVYKIYSFDGSKWSTGTDLTKQTLFTGKLDKTTNLYAYYDVVEKQKSEVELFGSYDLAKYVPIVGDVEFRIRLNQGFAFNTSVLRVNSELPRASVENGWLWDENGESKGKDSSKARRGSEGIDFPYVAGLKYTIGGFDSYNGVENSVMIVRVKGTPTIATVDGDGNPVIDSGSGSEPDRFIVKINKMQVVIPEKYIVAPEDKVGFAELESNEKLFTSCRIIPTPIEVQAQTISGTQYTEITSGKQELKISMSNFLINNQLTYARFNMNLLNSLISKEVPSDILITTYDPNDTSDDGQPAIINRFPGLKFTIKRMEGNNKTMVVEVTGIPIQIAENWPISIKIPEKYIESGENATTKDKLVTVSTKNTYYNIIGIKIITSKGGPIDAIIGVKNVDSKGIEQPRQIEINITTGGRFNTKKCAPDTEVPTDIISADDRLSGFKYIFGSSPDNNSTLIINVTGAPLTSDGVKDGHTLKITIPHNYLLGGEEVPADEKIVVNEDLPADDSRHYIYRVYRMKIGLTSASAGLDNANPIEATAGIKFGDGDGKRVYIETYATRENNPNEYYQKPINFVSSLAVLNTASHSGDTTTSEAARTELNNRLRVWFKDLEKSYNNEGDGSENDFSYEIVLGGSQESMSNVVGLNILGVSRLNKEITVPETATIKVPYSDIQGGITNSANTINTSIYYTNNKIGIKIADSDKGGSGDPIKGNSNEEIEVPVRIELTNAKFAQIKGADLDNWFVNLTNDFLANASYGIKDGGENQSYIVVNVKGRVKSADYNTKSVLVTVPKECIKGATLIEDQTTTVYYALDTGIGATVNATSDNGYFGNETFPVEGVRYVNLGGGKGVNVNIELVNGEFNTSIFANKENNLRIANWFKLWNNNGIIDSQYDVFTYGKNFVVVTIKGALTREVNTADGTYRINIGIPSIDIKNAASMREFTVNTSVYYRVTSAVTATLDNNKLYVGSTADNPLVASRYAPFDQNIKVKLTGATFKDKNRINISSWFSSLETSGVIINPTYTLVSYDDVNKNNVTINIKGALLQDESANTTQVYIDKNDIDAPLIENIPFTLYYKIEGTLQAKISPSAPYNGGDAQRPIEGIQYMPLGKVSGNILRIDLTNATFKNTLKSGMDVSSWFGTLPSSGVISKGKYTVYEGGAGLDWVTVKVEGVLTIEPNTTPDESVIYIDYKDLNLYVPQELQSDKFEVGRLYYRVTGKASAEFDTNSLYKGTEAHPIQGVKQVLIGNGKGVTLHLLLTNAVFKDGIDTDVTKWFVGFSDLKNAKCTIISGGSGTNFAFIQVEGAIDSTVIGVQHTQIEIEASSIEGYLPSNISIPLYYEIVSEVSATLVNNVGTQGYFVGTQEYPLGAVRGIGFGSGNGVHMKVVLSGAKFTELTDGIVTSWFSSSSLADTEDKILISPSATIIEGGNGNSSVEFLLNGTLTNLSNMTLHDTTIRIPKENIQDASLTRDVEFTMYYNLIGEVSANLDTNALYSGTVNLPLKGIQYMQVGENGKAPLVKVNLRNAKFKSSLKKGDNVTPWFNNIIKDTSSLFASIESIETNTANNTSSAIVRLTGALTCPVETVSRKEKLVISASDIDWYLSDSDGVEVEDYLYYMTTDVVTGTVNVTPTFDGKDPNIIYGTRYINFNGSSGYVVRIELNNTVFSSSVNKEISTDLSRWFAEFNEISENATYTLMDGGVDQDYVNVRIKGALNSAVGRVNTVNIHIMPSDLEGYLQDDITVPLDYCVDAESSASVFNNIGYFGGANYPLDGVQYVAINNGEGRTVRIVLENDARFVDNPELYTSQKLKEWFKLFTDISTDATYDMIALDADRKYIDIKVKGTLNTNVTTNQEVSVIIPHDVIDGYLKEDLTAKMYYRCSGLVTASLDQGDEYKGSSFHPIVGVKDILFNDGNGILVKINLSNIKFKQTLSTGTDVSSWFTNFTSVISRDGVKGDAYSVEDWKPNSSYVKVRIRGSLSTENLDTQSLDIIIPKEELVGTLPDDVHASMHFRISNVVEAYMEGNDEYKGGSDNFPIAGVQNVDINNGEGVKLKITLIGDNSKFRRDLDSSDVANWFSGINQYFASAPDWDIITLNDERNVITLLLKGALTIDYDNTAERRKIVEVLIPPADIENASFKDSIRLSVALEVTDKVRVSLTGGEDYYGNAENNAITGIKDIPLNDEKGVKIKITLTNTTFSATPTAAQIATMFSEFRELSNKDITVVSGGQGASELILNIKGELKFEKSTTVNRVTLSIPKEIINWNYSGFVSNDPTVTLFARTTDVPTVTIDNASNIYLGGKDHTISGVQYLPLNNGNGVLIKLNLHNAKFRKTYFNSASGAGFDNGKVENWFQNLTQIQNRVVSIIAVDDTSIVIRLQGEISASQAEGVRNVAVSVSGDSIIGSVTSLEDRIYYESIGNVTVQFDNPGEDPATGKGVYQGNSERNPILGTQYKSLNSGKGQLVYLKVSNSVFQGLKNGDVINDWFKSFTENIGNPKYTIVDVDTDYLIILVEGALSVRNGDPKSIEVRVPTDKIYGQFADPTLYATLYYQTDKTIQATLDPSYSGSEGNAIKGIRNVTLGDGAGAYIRINLTNATFNVKTKDANGNSFAAGYVFSNTGDQKENYWFDNVNAMVIGKEKPGTSPAEYDLPEYTVSSGGNGFSYVTIKIDGAFNQRAPVVATPVNIQISTSAVEAVLEAPLLAPVYIQANNGVTAKLDDSNSAYFGSVSYPLESVKNVYMNDGKGYQIKIDLTGGTFNQLSNADVSEWFEGFTGNSINRASYEIVGGGTEGSKYVMINVKGALSVITQGNRAAQFNIRIKPEHIKGARFKEDVIAEMYYQCNKIVVPKINGKRSENIEMIQYINVGDNPTGDGSLTDGIELKISLDNAKFVQSASTINEASINGMFKDFLDNYNKKSASGPIVAQQDRTLKVRYKETSADGSYITIAIYGYAPFGDDEKGLFGEDWKIEIPSHFVQNGLAIVSTSDGDISTIADEDQPHLRVFNPTKNAITLTIDDGEGYYGSVNKPLTGIINTPIGDGGQGVLIKLKLYRGKFGSYVGTNANNLAAWFTSLRGVYSSSFSYSVYGDSGVGKDTLTVRVAGSIDRVTPKNNARLSISYLYIQGAVKEFESIDTNLFYEGLEV